MTPGQFVSRIRRAAPPAACLFLGAEAYARDRCRAALIEAALPPEDRENGLARYDLAETSLSEIVDDARSLSLFASRRLIIVAGAEAALPRLKSDEEEDGEARSAGGAGVLEDYLKDPTPGVVLLIEAVRFDFEGDDRKKLERIAKFFAAVPEVVEFRRYAAEEARSETQELARRAGVSIGRAAVDLLVESLGADMARIAVEIEKLRLFGRPVTEEAIAELVPDARASTIFALVSALGRRDRARALGILDTLVRDGEYLPLALAFLGTQFRMALVAREEGLRTGQQIVSYFTRAGIPVWSSRAEQVCQTMSKFTKPQLELGLKLIFEADRGLRNPRPDDRIVMERFILALTA